MSTTGQVSTFSELYTDLQNRVRITTGVTATEDQAKRYVNIALHDMHLGTEYKFPWAERQAVLVTHARYTTGTVTITKGSNALTGIGTAWTTDTGFGVNNMQVGGKVLINGAVEPYEVAAVGSATSATLSSRFVDEDVAAVAYVYYEDEYALVSDFFRPLVLSFFDSNSQIRMIGRDEFYRAFPRNSHTGKPQCAMLIDKAPSGSTARRRRVVFARPPDLVYMLTYRYITSNLVVASDGTAKAEFTAAADEPLVPLRYRHAILYHALTNWYRDKKDESRAADVWAQYVDILQRISGDVEIGSRVPRLQPRVSPYAKAAKRPWSGRGTRSRYYDTDGSFDRLE